MATFSLSLFILSHLLFSFFKLSTSIHSITQFQSLIDGNTSLHYASLATFPSGFCDTYAICGPYGYCDPSKSPSCLCLEGFKVKSQEKWNMLDFVDGCVRDKPLNCSENDVGFRMFTEMKAPAVTTSWVNRSMNIRECRVKCLSNCSCSAYGNSEGSGSGCVNWFGDLLDLKLVPSGGQDLYVRMPASELKSESKKGKKKIGLAIGCAVASVFAILFLGLYIYCRKSSHLQLDKEEKEDLELPLFDLSTITSATDNFSINKKLGEGGFGPVYKGRLANGQEIAVKRLSKNSGQGQNEFKNEVILIAKLQHRNLVKLLGCCIQGEEKMLIYEYMPNRSLDAFIFDQTQGKLLNWATRFRIICGIARGLVYLHQDSRLRIIHRDLKASNVLLDLDMSPKISDFGLARIFGGDQTEANTRRVVGTYGYMAPEYAIDGQFSVKSDVFSFGILMLEIISGKRNRGFYRPNSNDLNLIAYAWRLWKDGQLAGLIDETFGDSFTFSEVLRCIHIGLLCVQQDPEDRPTMPSVIMMLGSENSVLPQPKQPGFSMEGDFGDKDFQASNDQFSSTNEMSITVLQPR